MELYIAQQKVDLPKNFSILMNYELEDRTNPTVVKNSFSKSLEIPGTDNNNRIFGSFFRNDRYQAYGSADSGAYFDPSKRVSFGLYENGDLIQDGYCKLDKVKKKYGHTLYYITLFGGLGEFFYNLTYRSDGETKTLADLDFGQDLSFKINKDNVQAAWNALGTTGNTKWHIINFAPSYNGIPDNFDSSSVLINTAGSSLFTTASTVDDQEYTTVDGFAVGKLDKAYDEWQMRDLRSYLQRPVLRVKSLLNACFDPANNSGDTSSGYTVDLDTDFFNENNPYYEDAWISLPMLNTDADEEITSNPSKTSFDSTSTNSGITGTTNIRSYDGDLDSTNGVIDTSEYPFSYVSISADFNLTVNNTNTSNVLLMSKYDRWSSWIFWDKERVSYGAVFVQLLAYDADTNRLLGGSDIYCFLNPNRASSADKGYPLAVTPDDFIGSGSGKYTPVYNAGIAEVRGHFRSDGSNHIFRSEDGYDTWRISIDKCQKANRMKFVLRCNKAWCARGDKPSGDGWDVMANKLYDGVANKFYYNNIYINPNGTGALALMSPSSVSSDCLISQTKLLASEHSPADYLLSYSKMFGLHWFKDRYENKIYCRTRNNYYYPIIEDIDDLIDHSQDEDVTPIVFDHKWYSMTQETPETFYSDKYSSDWGRTFGQQKINTNYNFDTETKELLENLPYKNAIMARAYSPYFNDYRNRDGNWVPSFFIDGFNEILYYGNDEQEIQQSANNIDWSYISPWYDIQGFDWNPKACFYEQDGNERKPVEINDVLLFYNGKKTPPSNFWLTDDENHMISLNDEVCWLFTESPNDSLGNNIAIQLSSIPEFSRYRLNDNSVVKSFDFGDPKEMYVDNYSLGVNSNIYDQYWKGYLSDQYNVNARVVTCYVLWNRIVTEELQRRFWWFDNAIWMLNKIIDYDVNSNKPTKCEFIKIIDTTNYCLGQLTPVRSSLESYDDPGNTSGPPVTKADEYPYGYDETGDTCTPIQFEDVLTKAYAVEAWDINGDGELDICEAAAVDTLGTVFSGTGIQSFNEIVYFTGINGIEDNAFKGCENLTGITLPDNIDYIGSNAFSGCTDLTFIEIKSTDPPVLGEGAFDDTNNCPIIINCNYLADFQRDWPQYASRFVCAGGGELIAATAITLNVSNFINSGTATYTLSPASANNYNISWSSSDTSIATIDGNGNMTALANGYTRICVYENVSGLSACKQIYVTKTQPVYGDIDITPDTRSVEYTSGQTTFNISTTNII